MKRSEARDDLLKTTLKGIEYLTAEKILDRIADLGLVTWDPEEPEWTKRVVLDRSGLMVIELDDEYRQILTTDQRLEAVRRYNLWPRLEELITR